jgi:hypothetical protein
MSDEAHREWTAHLCGLCLTLRDEHGQASRVVTNYDALAVSVLWAAQLEDGPLMDSAGPCPLRGFRGAEVLDSSGDGARFAAAVALLMAATKVSDHVTDGDTALRHVARPAAAVAARWQRAGELASGRLGFRSALITDQTARQAAVEATDGDGLAAYAEPTELAAGAVFAHTASLAGRPGNQAILFEAGRAFGRIVYLLDAVEDLDADRKHDAFNPLLRCCRAGAGRGAARQLVEEAQARLRRCLDEALLPRPELARHLLVDQLAHRAAAILGAGPPASPPPPGGDPVPWPAPGSGSGADPKAARPRRLRRAATANAGILGCALCQLCTHQPCTACQSCNCNQPCVCAVPFTACGSACSSCGDACGKSCSGCGDSCGKGCNCSGK